MSPLGKRMQSKFASRDDGKRNFEAGDEKQEEIIVCRGAVAEV